MNAKRATAAALLLALPGLSGCSTTGFGRAAGYNPAPYETRGGTAVRSFRSSKDLGANVRKSLEDVGVHSVNEVRRPEGLAYEGRTVDGRRASVVLAGRGELTMVSARFGMFGDEPTTRAFFDQLGGLTKSETKPGADPDVERASAEDEQPAPRRSRFSKAAVSDEEMLRNQADAGYRDTPIP